MKANKIKAAGIIGAAIVLPIAAIGTAYWSISLKSVENINDIFKNDNFKLPLGFKYEDNNEQDITNLVKQGFIEKNDQNPNDFDIKIIQNNTKDKQSLTAIISSLKYKGDYELGLESNTLEDLFPTTIDPLKNISIQKILLEKTNKKLRDDEDEDTFLISKKANKELINALFGEGTDESLQLIDNNDAIDIFIKENKEWLKINPGGGKYIVDIGFNLLNDKDQTNISENYEQFININLSSEKDFTEYRLKEVDYLKVYNSEELIIDNNNFIKSIVELQGDNLLISDDSNHLFLASKNENNEYELKEEILSKYMNADDQKILNDITGLKDIIKFEDGRIIASLSFKASYGNNIYLLSIKPIYLESNISFEISLIEIPNNISSEKNTIYSLTKTNGNDFLFYTTENKFYYSSFLDNAYSMSEITDKINDVLPEKKDIDSIFYNKFENHDYLLVGFKNNTEKHSLGIIFNFNAIFDEKEKPIFYPIKNFNENESGKIPELISLISFGFDSTLFLTTNIRNFYSFNLNYVDDKSIDYSFELKQNNENTNFESFYYTSKLNKKGRLNNENLYISGKLKGIVSNDDDFSTLTKLTSISDLYEDEIDE